MLLWATARIARPKLAVDHDSGCAPNTVGFRLGSYIVLLHVVDNHFLRRLSEPLDQFNGFFAG